MLAILSGVILVLFFAKLDKLISRHYLTIFEVLYQLIYYWLDYYSNRNCEFPAEEVTCLEPSKRKVIKDEYIFFHQ